MVLGSGYHSEENLSCLEEKGIDGYVPDEDQARSKKHKFEGREEPFAKKNFRYIEEADVYICP